MKPRPLMQNWKPKTCPCGAPNPTHSRNGRLGPWLCADCYRRAQ